MTEIDLDTEIREYQWRRKFERERPRRLQTVLTATIVLVVLSLAARSVMW